MGIWLVVRPTVGAFPGKACFARTTNVHHMVSGGADKSKESSGQQQI